MHSSASIAMLFFLGLPSAPAAIVVTEKKIVINRDVAFAPGSAKPTAAGQTLISELADALTANERFTKLRIEGHTDNQGDDGFNLRLSQRRADAVKRILVKKGVQARRLSAVGFGSSRPVDSNKTARGRKNNRRVVLTTLEIDGKSVRGKRPPLAKISSAQNDVGASAPQDSAFKAAAVGLGLGKSWRVKTEDSSSAGITFRDASALEMREQSLVIIFGATQTKTKRVEARARLQSGSLTSRLRELVGGGLVIETESADTELGKGEALVRVSDDGASTVSNFAGESAKVYGKKKSGRRMKKSVRVKKGYGSKVKKGKPPQKPRKLPPTPVHESTETLHALVGPFDTVTLQGAWHPVKEATQYHVEIRAANAGAAAMSIDVPGQTTSFRFEDVSAGEYEVRVSAIDSQGFESPPSATRAVRVIRLALDTATDGNGTGRARTVLRPGDAVLVPDNTTCSTQNQTTVGPGQLLIENSATMRVVCRVTGIAATQRELTFEVEPLTLPVDALKIRSAKPQRIHIEFPGMAGREIELTAMGGTVADADFSVGKSGSAILDALVTADATVSEVTLTVRVGGATLGEVTSTIMRDGTPPTLVVSSIEPKTGKVDIQIIAKDDVGAVRYVTARWSNQEERDAIFLARGDENLFVGALDEETAPADRTVVLTTADDALNATSQNVVVAAKEGTISGFVVFPIAIMALGVVPLAVGAIAAADAVSSAFGGPVLAGLASNRIGVNANATTLVTADIVIAAVGSVVGFVVIGVGAAAFAAFLVDEE